MTRIRFVERTGSTNSDLLAERHAPEGEWLIAARQEQGRGRQNRTWESPSGNFHGSTLIRLAPTDPQAGTLALAAGLALIRATGDFDWSQLVHGWGRVNWGRMILFALLVAVIGAAVGLAAGVAYNRLLLNVLLDLWPDSEVRSYLKPHATLPTFAIGFGSTILMALGALWLGVRNLVKVAPPVSARTLVIAAVSDVLPWST